MRARFVAGCVLGGALTLGCPSVVIISPYDTELDRGIQDVKQRVNVLVADAASKAGTPQGAFQAYEKQWAEIEVQIASMRDRAAMQEADDLKCVVPEGLRKSFAKAFASLPAIAVAPKGKHVTSVAVPNDQVTPARGCMTVLLDNAGSQLMDLEAIHAQPAQCGTVSCLTKDAAMGALLPANQSLDMALFVELYKKKDEETK